MVNQWMVAQNQPLKLGPEEDQILKLAAEGKTLKEIAPLVSRTFSGVRYILQKMQEKGLVTYKPGKARGRTVTQLGLEYLRANGLVEPPANAVGQVFVQK